MKHTLITAVVALVLAQVAPAQSSTESAKVEPETLVTQLVTLIGSPDIHRGKGLAFKRTEAIAKKSSDTQTVSVVAPGSEEFGFEVSWGFKDGTVVRVIKDSEGRKGLEIWWPRSDAHDTGTSNTITAYHDGTFGYCMLNGMVRYSSEMDSPCGDSLSIQAVADTFVEIGTRIAEYLEPHD